MTELRQRLERLPVGHPSSSYEDDGSRKPPVIRLKDLELPLPDDAGAPENGDTEAPEADHADGPEAGWDADLSEPDEDAELSEPDEDAELSETGGDTETPGTGEDAELPDTARDADLSDTDRRAETPETADDRPWTRRDGSWEWKGSHLTPGECRIADDMISRCRAAEGRNVFGTYGDAGLTPTMRRIEAQLEHGRLVPDTENFALKSADRFKEKLAGLKARYPGIEPGELASGIHDTVRYTFLFEASHYTDGMAEACRVLTDQGYELFESRPSWDKDEYKGVNSRWRDLDSGLFFEVQWHTPESWDAKQKTHLAYEKIGDPRTPISEVERLRAYQREMSASVTVPPGALEIPPYKKES